MPPTKLELPILDDRPGPAPPIAEDEARRIVSEAVESVFAQPRWLRSRTYAKWPLVMAATLVVTAAAAASVFTATHRRTPVSMPEAPVSTQPAASAAPAVAAPTVATELRAPETAPPADRAATAPPVPENGGALHAPRPPADDLLREANELRAARRWRDAARAYERVLAIHPGSPEAYAATVAAADLHLEQMGDPRGALRLYRIAQQKGAQGSLAEQVLWGIARCDAALADRDGERRALSDYLARYPAGLFAPDAQRRLTDLSSAPH
jgi:hypothetical protein